MVQPRALEDAEICEMLQMFNKGWTMKEIAIYFGVSTQVVLEIRGGDFGRAKAHAAHPSG